MEENRKVFAFIVDEDVFHFMTIPDQPQFAGVIAGLQSKPLLLDVTDRPELLTGGYWKYIDGEIVKHEFDTPEDEDYEVE